MKVEISSIAAEEVAGVLRDATNNLEDALQPALADRFYGAGVEQFSAFAVAVASDRAENDRFCRDVDKAGRLKHPISGVWIKYVSLALPFDPAELLGLDAAAVERAFCDKLLARLDSPAIRLPKGFDYESLVDDLTVALNIVLVSIA
jgi:hypothetical protein